jgi:hypothetical protein
VICGRDGGRYEIDGLVTACPFHENGINRSAIDLANRYFGATALGNVVVNSLSVGNYPFDFEKRTFIIPDRKETTIDTSSIINKFNQIVDSQIRIGKTVESKLANYLNGESVEYKILLYKAVSMLKRSPWLLDQVWFNFAWLMKRKNIAKVIEGRYIKAGL